MFEELLRRSQLTVETLASLLRDLVRSTWFKSVDLTVVIPAGSTEAKVRHGLGRAFNGAAIVGQSSVITTIGVKLADEDAETYLTVFSLDDQAFDITVKLRVY